MRFAAILAALSLASGCSYSAVYVNNGVPAANGTSVTSGASGLSVTSNSGAAVVFLLTLGAIDYALNPRPFPSPGTLMPDSTPPAPALATNRRISEQDCSKPVDLTLGNLRCK